MISRRQVWAEYVKPTYRVVEEFVREPWTCVVVEAYVDGETIRGAGFSRANLRLDAFNEEFGIRKATGRAITDCVERALQALCLKNTYKTYINFTDKLEQLKYAAAHVKAVQIDYIDRHGERTTRDILPTEFIVSKDGGLVIVVAYCYLREDYRQFYVGDIEQLRVFG